MAGGKVVWCSLPVQTQHPKEETFLPFSPKTRLVVALGLVGAFASTTLSFPYAVHAFDEPPPDSGPSANSLPVFVTVSDGDNAARTLTATGATVGDALQNAGVTFSHDDRIVPTPNTPLTAGQRIVIHRVRFVTQTERQAVPFEFVFKMSRDVPPGHITRGRAGQPGVLARTFRVSYLDGKMTSRRQISKDLTVPPTPQETLGGIRLRSARALPSRGGFYRRLRCYTMTATGYSPYEGSGSGRCATGMRAGYGVVAVDPRVIRLGSRLFIEGYGYAVAGDTGGAIKGHRIDLGHTTYREASNVGRRKVKVWVLSGG